MNSNRTYIAIDLKSFYASVECLERGLDPLNTNLVVADASRTEKTICLAVSPSLKKFGISGRARLFEAIQSIKEANAKRRLKAPQRRLVGESHFEDELNRLPQLAIGYIAAPPRMAMYMAYSAKIYDVYLRYVAPEDIHVYSIDEVFMDITQYLATTQLTPYDFAKRILIDVLQTVGMTATAGIGTNLYLCKIAMDILAKHVVPDADGVRIAQLDEITYRKELWSHQPLTDFWRVGRGYSKKLNDHQLYTMGDIARCSLENEALLYNLFGINAELLIDHAWGWEPCTIADVRAYKPSNKSTGAGQVLHRPYPFKSARIIVQEMTDTLVLDLVEKGLVTDQLVLTIGYDISNLSGGGKNAYHGAMKNYQGEIKTDYYGRQVPKHGHGTVNLKQMTSSTGLIMAAVLGLYDEITDPNLLIRRINLAAGRLSEATKLTQQAQYVQLDFFTDFDNYIEKEAAQAERLERENKLQKTVIELKKKFGKNAVLKGTNLQEDANAKDRNNQIGGHKA